MPRQENAYFETVNGFEVNYFYFDKKPYVYCGDAFSAIGLHDNSGNYTSKCETYLKEKRDYIVRRLSEVSRRRCYLTSLGVYNALSVIKEKSDLKAALNLYDGLELNTPEREAAAHMVQVMEDARTKGFPAKKTLEKERTVPAKKNTNNNGIPTDSYGVDLLEDILSSVYNLSHRLEQVQKEMEFNACLNMANSTTASIVTLEAIMASPLTVKNKKLKEKVDKTLLSFRQKRETATKRMDTLLKEMDRFGEGKGSTEKQE